MQTHAEIAALHFASYHVPGALYAAPGRVNLIGEHTDYSDGFVMPAAIDFATVVAISPRSDGRILAHSVNYDERIDKTVYELLDEGFATLRAGRKVHWSDYPAGVLWALREHGVPVDNGFSLTIVGNVPLGAGLSSSASIEVATAIAVLGATSYDLQLTKIALLCQRAENAFVGANCGIMDQFVSCYGHQDNAVMIDCRWLEYQLAPIPPDVRIVICNSMVKHSVAGGEYNTRRAEIEAGHGDPARAPARDHVAARRDGGRPGQVGPRDARQRAQALPPCRHRKRPRSGGCRGLPRLQPDPLRRVDAPGPHQPARRLRGVVQGDRHPGGTGRQTARLLRRAPHRRRLRRLHRQPGGRQPRRRLHRSHARRLPGSHRHHRRRSTPAAPPAAPTPSRCRRRVGRLS